MKNTDKQIDDLAKKMMSSSGLEKPSVNFTANIMSQIEAIKSISVLDSKPLISKTAWFGIAIAVIGLFAYSFFNTSTESLGLFENVDLSFISNNKISELLSSFTISKTVLYSVLLFGIMFSIQIPLLKNYLDKRYEV